MSRKSSELKQASSSQPLAPSSIEDGKVPLDDFVVSRYADQSPASLYGDLTWDWTPYVADARSSVLNFQFWQDASVPSKPRLALVEEVRWIVFLVSWRRPGPRLAFETLTSYVKTLRALARYCERVGKTIKSVLTETDTLLGAVDAMPVGSLHAKVIGGLLTTLARLGEPLVGYTVAGERAKKAVNVIVQEYARSAKQHPPLPTRIYSHVISTLLAELRDFERVADNYFSLIEKCIENPFFGRMPATQFAIAQRLGIKRDPQPNLADLLEVYSLTDYFHSKDIRPKANGLSAGLTRIQSICRLIVHVFSGMRDEEVERLSYGCLEISYQGDRPYYVITGITTKLNNGKPKPARWVTSSEAAKALEMAHRIAEVCRRGAAAKSNVAVPEKEALPLFLSTAYLRLGGQSPKGKPGTFLAGVLDLDALPALRADLQPVITEIDLKELEQIDPHRAWRSEARFQLGGNWRFTTHQLRRSLVLYAHRSGLVSLPSLRRQLQHVTEAMTRYYARGSAFADNFIDGDKEHVGSEWREVQPVSSALAYILSVLTTDDVLFGAHGSWVQHRLRGADGLVLVDRDATIARFKKGELAYKETLLGGCTSTESCEIQPIKWLQIDCAKGCKNMVGRLSKLERVIVAQSKMVSRLDRATVEYRAENGDLGVLLDIQQKVKDQIRTSVLDV